MYRQLGAPGSPPPRPIATMAERSFRAKHGVGHFARLSLMEGPDTRYARTRDGVHVAYQTLGDGPLDLLCVGYGNMVSIDMRDEEPHFGRFERRLASFSRYIRFDSRGLGLSDPIGPGVPGASSRESTIWSRSSMLSALSKPPCSRWGAAA